MLDFFASALAPYIFFFLLLAVFVLYLIDRYIQKTREPASLRCDGGRTTRLFLDCEFTGLQQKTSLVSLALVSEDGREFYAEFGDYDRSQVSPWVEENVIDSLFWKGHYSVSYINGVRGDLSDGKERVVATLREWLSQFERVEIWGDVLAYDWVLFCELFPIVNEDTAERLPSNIFYIPFDISTLMMIKGIDPDISREEFSGTRDLKNHNSLDDARIIRACFEKLKEM